MAEELSKASMAVLREIGTIGAGHAATSLSKLLGKQVRIMVPFAEVLPIPDAIEKLGGSRALVTAVFLKILGTLDGSFLMLFHVPDATRLADLILGSHQEKVDGGMAESALKEVGNICSGSYLLALSEILNLRSIHSVPGLATDLLPAVLDGVFIDVSHRAGWVVVLETEFEVREEKVGGHLLFIPSPEGLPALLQALERRPSR